MKTENLTTTNEGLQVEPFLVKSQRAMLRVETTGTLSFYLSVNESDYNEYPVMLNVDEKCNEILEGMVPGTMMYIACTAQMFNVKILWEL